MQHQIDSRHMIIRATGSRDEIKQLALDLDELVAGRANSNQIANYFSSKYRIDNLVVKLTDWQRMSLWLDHLDYATMTKTPLHYKVARKYFDSAWSRYAQQKI